MKKQYRFEIVRRGDDRYLLAFRRTRGRRRRVLARSARDYRSARRRRWGRSPRLRRTDADVVDTTVRIRFPLPATSFQRRPRRAAAGASTEFPVVEPEPEPCRRARALGARTSAGSEPNAEAVATKATAKRTGLAGTHARDPPRQPCRQKASHRRRRRALGLAVTPLAPLRDGRGSAGRRLARGGRSTGLGGRSRWCTAWGRRAWSSARAARARAGRGTGWSSSPGAPPRRPTRSTRPRTAARSASWRCPHRTTRSAPTAGGCSGPAPRTCSAGATRRTRRGRSRSGCAAGRSSTSSSNAATSRSSWSATARPGRRCSGTPSRSRGSPTPRC